RGCLPSSAAFLEYATGDRALALMGISREWWSVSTCHRFCYERLVDDPTAELERLASHLEHLSAEAIRSAIARNSLERTRPKVTNQHHWIGASAQWKKFITPSAARRIASAHALNMDLLKYDCEPDESLTATQADLNWFAQEIQSLRQELSRTRTQLLDARARLETAELFLGRARQVVRPFKPLHELGRQSVRLAQRLRAHAVRPFIRKAG